MSLKIVNFDKFGKIDIINYLQEYLPKICKKIYQSLYAALEPSAPFFIIKYTVFIGQEILKDC